MERTPSVTPPPSTVPDSAPAVIDRRPSPRGVLPRGVHTWLLAGLAGFMLLIMLVVGQPDAPSAPTSPTPAPSPASPDRVREYQNRLRALETESVAQATDERSAPAPYSPADTERQPPPPVDPIAADRRRRDYESLFASNVVSSRRPASERPDIGGHDSQIQDGLSADMRAPSMDDLADAAIRATARVAGLEQSRPQAPGASNVGASVPGSSREDAGSPQPRTSQRTESISATGPLHRILEGTIVDTVLTNRLDGTSAAPVNCLVTNPVYSHSGRHVLVPSGARLLGETKPVQSVGETRLAVAFHRLLMPDGRTYRLDQFMGLNQIGDAGLQDRVNQHYVATFGAAAAVGLVSGLSQLLGSAAVARGDGDRTVIVGGGVGDATSQATTQVMNRFLNRLPTVTIREGHRVKVYVTADLELPAYVATGSSAFFREENR
jgi:type IV secretion system protein TrbI